MIRFIWQLTETCQLQHKPMGKLLISIEEFDFLDPIRKGSIHAHIHVHM